MNRKIIRANEIPLGAGMSIATMGLHTINENNQNILLNVIFVQTLQEGQCVKHNYPVNNSEIDSLNGNYSYYI